MARTPMTMTLELVSDAGECVETYVLSAGDEGTRQGRLDVVTSTTDLSRRSSVYAPSTVLSRLMAPFLPVGYPDSVSGDYTAYQVYDSVQALFSTAASLLASRAVLTTLGVGSSDATTSFALTLSILQTTISNAASILFAHRFSIAIAHKVKFWRFFADIVNDTAFVLDVLSPSLPEWARVPVLCAASACRSICGVAGGSSKAVLSTHFAKGANVGELAAKDGSQEVLINLIGMWIGGFVVARIDGTWATWIMLMGFLAGHLWANYMAVSSIRLRTLDGRRAEHVVENLVGGNISEASIEHVGRREAIIFAGSAGTLRAKESSNAIGYRFGNMRELLACQGWVSQARGRAYMGDMSSVGRLFKVFEREDYLLGWSRHESRCVVVLKSGADVGCQLKAMCHILTIASDVDQTGKDVSEMEVLERTLSAVTVQWPQVLSAIQQQGWDVKASRPVLDTGTRLRVRTE
jgi:hypothetical protein